MQKKLFITLVLICLPVLGGCSTAYTGLDGNNMYTNTNLDVAVIPEDGLVPFRSASTAIDIETTSNVGARTYLDYAIYGDPGDGPVTRHGHVIFATFSDKNRYAFQPQTFARANELDLETQEINGRDWRVHTLYEDGESDWFSKVWRENGRETPEIWIGKRYSRTFNQTSRVIVEYREPLPACAKIEKTKILSFLDTRGLSVGTEECRREVDAVFERADQAFTIGRASELELTGEVPENIITKKTLPAMDGARYIGTAIYNDPITR